jgi:hypothetical protein
MWWISRRVISCRVISASTWSDEWEGRLWCKRGKHIEIKEVQGKYALRIDDEQRNNVDVDVENKEIIIKENIRCAAF